jgi:hypothetical protein
VISFVNRGRWGRPGNQMFQYAATLSVAKHIGVPAIAPLQYTTLKDSFKLGDVVSGMPSELDGRYDQGDEFTFDEKIFDLPPDKNIDLFGYFQSEKFFKHIEDVVRENFEFKDDIQKLSESKHKDFNVEKTVSIHVRRGDYLKLSHVHPSPDVSYYDNAMTHFENHTPVVFSDDIEWCKENFKHMNAIFVDGNDIHTDMCMMSLCDGHIIANSSFSWWAAWLGKGKTVAPKKWFGEQGPRDWSDIYCEGWIKC